MSTAQQGSEKVEDVSCSVLAYQFVADLLPDIKHKISISADPKEVKPVTLFPESSDLSSLRPFLGLTS